MGQEYERTRDMPPGLEAKIVQAKKWFDNRQVMIENDFPDAAAWSDSVAEGNLLLADIVDLVDETWGFGPQSPECG